MSASQAISGFGTLLKRGDGGVGAGTKASRTIGTSNQQVIIRAKTAGTAGNSKTCSILVSGNNTPFSFTVTETSLVITSATDGSAVATTTVNELLYQLYQNATFVSYWEATRGAGNGTGILVAASSAALSGGAAGSEIFTTLAEVISLSGPDRSVDLIDVTHMESPNAYKEFIGSLKDSGNVSFQINYVPGNTSQEQLYTDFEARTRNNYQIVFPSSVRTWQFAAVVQSISNSFAIDDRLMADVEMKVSADVQPV